jgi:hypothetical protein
MNTEYIKGKVWYKWPKGYIGSLVPWYVILRRLVASPIQYFGFGVLYVGTTLGYGLSDAEAIRKDMF